MMTPGFQPFTLRTLIKRIINLIFRSSYPSTRGTICPTFSRCSLETNETMETMNQLSIKAEPLISLIVVSFLVVAPAWQALKLRNSIN